MNKKEDKKPNSSLININSEMLKEIEESKKEIENLFEQISAEKKINSKLKLENFELKNKIAYNDAFVEPNGCTSIRVTAKELQISEKKFIEFLIQAGFLYRMPSGTLVPYETKKGKELFVVKEFYRNGHYGAHTLITPKAKLLFGLLYPDNAASSDNSTKEQYTDSS